MKTIGTMTSDGDALVTVTVESAPGETREMEAVLDTGFNGFLALPADVIRALDLVYRYELQLTLANGAEQSVPTYEATIRWNGARRSVEVVEAGEVLAGTALFWGHAVRVECQTGGGVTAVPL
jgi:clan AA aspartic protease